MKSAFSFLELLVVLMLLLLLYGVFFSNFKIQPKQKEETASLKNLKAYLLKNYEFTTQLQLVCLKYEAGCFVFLDGKKDKSSPLELDFPAQSQVYKYQANLEKLEFQPAKFENFEAYETLFEFSIKHNRSDRMIIETPKEVILYHAFEKPSVLERISQVDDFFEQRINEVKDAF